MIGYYHVSGRCQMSEMTTREEIAEIAKALLHELDDRMKSPRGDYYQGDVADPHLSLHIVERHIDALLARLREQCEYESKRADEEMLRADSAERALDSIRADLRACAEVLGEIRQAVDNGDLHDATVRVRVGKFSNAALARPGVTEALK
jgi:hypothetical protein